MTAFGNPSRSRGPDSSVDEVTPMEAKQLKDTGRGVIVDVREADEWQQQRIPGAKHIPLGQLTTRKGELPQDRLIVFQCATGSRSAMAADALGAAGFKTCNLDGGIEAWAGAGLPVERGE